MTGAAPTFILLAVLTALFGGVGYLVGGAGGMIIALGVAVIMNAYSYWNADKIVLRMHRAREVGPDEPSRVVRTFAEDTRRMAEAAGMPAPRVYIIDTPQPNAFATGRDQNHAAVAATSGLLSMLTREEVAGVMAHELAHIRHRDTLTMTVTATIAGAIGILANVALFFGSRERGGLIGGLAVMIFAPMAAGLVQMAISRSREYQADRGGAEICGNPLWLASALQKIERGARAVTNQQAERNPSLAHLYIINPLNGRGRDNLFSTHPSTANRVAALRQMAAEMDAPAPSADAEPARPRGPWG